jgi:hypothetical protein
MQIREETAQCPAVERTLQRRPGCGEGHDRARAAQSDVITAIGSEGTPTRIQLRNRPGIPHSLPVPIERQDSIAAAVEKEQFLFFIDRDPARVGNTRIAAKGAEQPPLTIESQKCSTAIASDTLRACNK